MTCKVCDRPATYTGKQLCHTHYEKLRRTGTLQYRPKPEHCRECGKGPVLARGLCRNDYMLLKRTGGFDRLRERRHGWTRSDWHRYSRYRVTPEDFAESGVVVLSAGSRYRAIQRTSIRTMTTKLGWRAACSVVSAIWSCSLWSGGEFLLLGSMST